MAARDAAEPHRAATPLELLFDLTFVVAIAAAAAELAHAIAEDHTSDGGLGYLMVFFAIWWAWINFTWFASAYDCDDVPYRLFTLLQMAGVLVLAAGIPAAFSDGRFTAVTIGYVVMRIGLIAQWLRAARQDEAHRPVAMTYAVGITVLQIGWLLRLALPDGLAFACFFLLVAGELSVPLVAERRASTTWHPHHIAERYGLFTIIVLGESVLAATRALSGAVAGGADADTVVLGAGGLVLLFASWWLYFLSPAGDALARRRDGSYRWGYGHYGIFAALAAVGAGLEVSAETLSHDIEAPVTLVALSVAVPVAIYLLLAATLHAALTRERDGRLSRAVAAAGALVAVAACTGLGLAVPWAVLLMGLVVAALVAAHVTSDHRSPNVPV